MGNEVKGGSPGVLIDVKKYSENDMGKHRQTNKTAFLFRYKPEKNWQPRLYALRSGHANTIRLT